MSVFTDFLVNEGITLANPLIISGEEMELEKITDPNEEKIVLEAINTLGKIWLPKLSGTTTGGKALIALLTDLQTGAQQVATEKGITL